MTIATRIRLEEKQRPAASIGIVLYHKLSDEPDDGYHRHRTSVPSLQ